MPKEAHLLDFLRVSGPGLAELVLWGTPRKELKDASAYIDESFLKEALK